MKSNIAGIGLLAAAVWLAACSPLASPTATPLPSPTADPQPNAWILESHPDWQYYAGDGFGLWLPPSYVAGMDPEDFAEIVAMLRDVGQNDMASMLEANMSSILFFAYDSVNTSTGAQSTNCNLVAEWNSGLIGMTAAEYAAIVESQMANFQAVHIFGSEPWQAAGFESGHRLDIQYDLMAMGGAPGTAFGVQYLMKNHDHVWALSFAATSDEFPLHSADFLDIALSFHER